VKLVAFLAGLAAVGLSSGGAQAQTLYEVEHARGNYRAGLVSEFDADLIRTWGAPSGNYPPNRFFNPGQPQRHVIKKRRVRAKR
jgi:hypothetical protein